MTFEYLVMNDLAFLYQNLNSTMPRDCETLHKKTSDKKQCA